jgi:periplasmic protein TonB
VTRFNSLKDPADNGNWEDTPERQLGFNPSHQVYVKIEPGTKMATANLDPVTKPEPELNLLMPKDSEQGLIKSLFQNLDDFFFPKKLPPLQLQSKPIPVRDIWGFYDYKKNGVLGSTILHVVVLAMIIGGTILARSWVKTIIAPKETVTYLAPDDTPALAPAKTQVGGGGGGGDRDKLQALKGKPPKFAMEQIAPPQVVVRNEHPKLAVEPTVIVPPQVQMASNMPNLGDPTSHVVQGPPSNGVGYGGGIGAGVGTGVGSGEGAGVGPGRGGGTGGGVFKVGGGVSAPRPIYQPDPEYSEEARKAKYTGTCVLWLVVGADGRPREVKVTRSVGLGLDEKAIEAVKTWKFEPAMKDGKPVAVQISVEVEFRLY